MARTRTLSIPDDWPTRVKSGLLHAVALASVAITAAQARIVCRDQLRARLDQASNEIALLNEEMAIKDGRWQRSRKHRRPHYLPNQRLRILQLRSARGWTLEKTASVFLVDFQTLQRWVRLIDDTDERHLVQTSTPVNHYPEFVRQVVRQTKRMFPALGYERMAQVLARAGLWLSASTIARMVREPSDDRDSPAEVTRPARRRAIGRRTNDVWHIDLTAVPRRAGFWVPWNPFALAQCWPFCWWVGVIVDQVSRRFVGFAFFRWTPTSSQIQAFLSRAMRQEGVKPRCIVSDKGPQFKARSYRRWCKARETRRTFGKLGERSSIPICERFIRTMKQECFRRVLVTASLDAARRELHHFGIWYNHHRPHSALGRRTPQEFIERRKPPPRIEPRERWRSQSRHPLTRRRFVLDVRYVAGRKHLPIIGLKRAS